MYCKIYKTERVLQLKGMSVVEMKRSKERKQGRKRELHTISIYQNQIGEEATAYHPSFLSSFYKPGMGYLLLFRRCMKVLVAGTWRRGCFVYAVLRLACCMLPCVLRLAQRAPAGYGV